MNELQSIRHYIDTLNIPKPIRNILFIGEPMNEILNPDIMSHDAPVLHDLLIHQCKFDVICRHKDIVSRNMIFPIDDYDIMEIIPKMAGQIGEESNFNYDMIFIMVPIDNILKRFFSHWAKFVIDIYKGEIITQDEEAISIRTRIFLKYNDDFWVKQYRFYRRSDEQLMIDKKLIFTSGPMLIEQRPCFNKSLSLMKSIKTKQLFHLLMLFATRGQIHGNLINKILITDEMESECGDHLILSFKDELLITSEANVWDISSTKFEDYKKSLMSYELKDINIEDFIYKDINDIKDFIGLYNLSKLSNEQDIMYKRCLLEHIKNSSEYGLILSLYADLEV